MRERDVNLRDHFLGNFRHLRSRLNPSNMRSHNNRNTIIAEDEFNKENIKNYIQSDIYMMGNNSDLFFDSSDELFDSNDLD